MKPAPFEYLVPDSLDAVLAILSEHGSDAKLLAGGQSLVPAMNVRRLQPRLLVDLNNLTDLSYVQPTDGGDLRIGAMTRESRLEHDPLVARWTPLMHEAVPHIAHPQIRNRGTLGGSLAHADPVAELPAVCVALDARIRIRSQAGERWVPAAEFFHGESWHSAPIRCAARCALVPRPAWKQPTTSALTEGQQPAALMP